MKLRKLAILAVVLLLLDQALKIWIKTHLRIDEAIEIFPWFQLRFVENNGAAFGMQIASSGGFDWGKLLLTSFRMAMIGLLGYYIFHLTRRVKQMPKGALIGLTMIFAGAVGNLIDSLLYGVIFTASTPISVATLGEGYSSVLMGKVVDMFYFPLFQWNNVPSWLDFLVDHNNYFFGAIFNLADSYICVAAVYLLIFHWRAFDHEE